MAAKVWDMVRNDMKNMKDTEVFIFHIYGHF